MSGRVAATGLAWLPLVLMHRARKIHLNSHWSRRCSTDARSKGQPGQLANVLLLQSIGTGRQRPLGP